MNLEIVSPLWILCNIRVLINTISEIKTVISSSLLAPFWATDGLIQIGGTGIDVHKKFSGLPLTGSKPRISQSF